MAGGETGSVGRRLLVVVHFVTDGDAHLAFTPAPSVLPDTPNAPSGLPARKVVTFVFKSSFRMRCPADSEKYKMLLALSSARPSGNMSPAAVPVPSTLPGAARGGKGVQRAER